MKYITKELLATYSGVSTIDNEINNELIEMYIGSAEEIVENYLGYTISERYAEVPSLIKNAILDIATIKQNESSNNITIVSKTDIEGGTRQYQRRKNFDDILFQITQFKDMLA